MIHDYLSWEYCGALVTHTYVDFELIKLLEKCQSFFYEFAKFVTTQIKCLKIAEILLIESPSSINIFIRIEKQNLQIIK